MIFAEREICLMFREWKKERTEGTEPRSASVGTRFDDHVPSLRAMVPAEAECGRPSEGL